MRALPHRATILLSQRAGRSLRIGKVRDMSWYLEAFKKYAVFSGRSRRKEY
jgi:hypothetical protein